MSAKNNSLIAPIIVLVLICLVASFLLAGVYQVTYPVIQVREAETMAKALASVLPKASSFTKQEGEGFVTGVSELYVADNGSGIVCTTECKSKQGGVIKMMVGIDSFGQVNGISVISHNETAGLGDKALAESYLQNYYGINSAEGIDEVDALSGVTKTSNCIKESCKAAIQQFIDFSKNSNPSVEKTEEEKLAAARNVLFPSVESFTKLTVDLEEYIIDVFQAADNKGYVFYVKAPNEEKFTAAISVDSQGLLSQMVIINKEGIFKDVEFTDEEIGGYFTVENPQTDKEIAVSGMCKAVMSQYEKLK